MVSNFFWFTFWLMGRLNDVKLARGHIRTNTHTKPNKVRKSNLLHKRKKEEEEKKRAAQSKFDNEVNARFSWNLTNISERK